MDDDTKAHDEPDVVLAPRSSLKGVKPSKEKDIGLGTGPGEGPGHPATDTSLSRTPIRPDLKMVRGKGSLGAIKDTEDTKQDVMTIPGVGEFDVKTKVDDPTKGFKDVEYTPPSDADPAHSTEFWKKFLGIDPPDDEEPVGPWAHPPVKPQED